MEFVIDCRFSDAFSTSPPIQELMPNAREVVLFSFAFSHEGTIDPYPASQVVTTALEELRQNFAPPLDFTVDSVTAEQGSVIITLLLASIVAPAAAPVVVPVGVITGVGGITLWAADRFLGGALSKAGEQLAQSVFSRLTGHAPTSIGELREPQGVADEQASEVAVVRGCSLIPMAGGMRVSIGENQTGYKYVYQLVGARPGLLSIIVDRYSRHPVEYHVFETMAELAVITPDQPDTRSATAQRQARLRELSGRKPKLKPRLMT
jgi:hypothetical protein